MSKCLSTKAAQVQGPALKAWEGEGLLETSDSR
jgi:hypothetical protein